MSNSMINGNGAENYRQISSIKGNLHAGRLQIKTSDTDAITVESTGTSDRLGFQAYEQGGVLYLQTNKTAIAMENGLITVTVPGDRTFDEIALELSVGELHADQLRANRLTVESGAGQAVIQYFTVRNARFVCGVGALSGQGDAAETLEVSCGIGQVNIDYTEES